MSRVSQHGAHGMKKEKEINEEENSAVVVVKERSLLSFCVLGESCELCVLKRTAGAGYPRVL